MRKWYQIFPKNTGLSLYVWLIFCVLPFYFIFKSSTKLEVFIGIFMVLLFFIAYRLSFISDNWAVYAWVSLEMTISLFMILFFGYVYFALFLAFFIGNIRSKVAFITFYIINLLTTLAAVSIGFILNLELFIAQLPFFIICLIGVIILPFTIYIRNKQEELESLLDDANEKISKLLVMEERQRIARDLHDTLGQKLSLIGLKSDLAGKLFEADPDSAKSEINDIHKTARTALKEVREMVSNMRNVRLEDELIRIRQMLNAAQINFDITGVNKLTNIPLLTENMLSMCLKEAVTNVVKHSKATFCKIFINEDQEQVFIQVQDNGNGLIGTNNGFQGYGLQGMRERLEFLNGSLEIKSLNGTTITIRIPKVIKGTTRRD